MLKGILFLYPNGKILFWCSNQAAHTHTHTEHIDSGSSHASAHTQTHQSTVALRSSALTIGSLC